MEKQAIESYENNPFNIALKGLQQFFHSAQSIAIAAIVISALGVFGQGVQSTINATTNQDTGEMGIFQIDELPVSTLVLIGVVVATVLFVLIILGLIVTGIADYTSAKLAHNEKATLLEALKEVLTHIGSYLWFSIILFVKLFLWTLLFIVPGIIMSVRYSLAGTAFFAEGKRGNDAIKRSVELTKGGWLTTFSASTLWNLMTFGVMEYVLRPGTNAVLYQQYSMLDKAKQSKPKAHILAHLTLWGTIALAIMMLLLVVVGAFFALSTNGFS